MLKKILLASLLFPCLAAFSQESADDRAAVVAAIQKMFDGMRAGDSAAVRAAFDSSARLQTTFTGKDGKPAVRSEEIAAFADAVGSPHEEVWDERIWSYDILIDGSLATAWTEYTFYLGEKMSHCGVNAFQLFRGEAGWKILQITDTRRRTDCQTSASADTFAVHALLDAWHRAAATADEDVFFGSMTPDAVYLGTDASERWLRDELREWSKKYFERESAWAFTPRSRHLHFPPSGDLAWFDELLDTWMGACRGSGVLQKFPDGWKLKQYNLAVTVPNEVIEGFIELVKNAPAKKD